MLQAASGPPAIHPPSVRPQPILTAPPLPPPPHPRAGRGCSWQPAREPAAAEKARGRACGAGQGEVAEAPVWAREGRPAPLGWAAGRWAEADGQRLPDETKAHGCLCLRIASHTRACTHGLVQPSKHEPVRTRTGHTDAKARRGSSRRCSSGPATRTHLCFCVPLSCTCTGSHAHTRIPPRAPALESHIWSPPASPSRAPSLSLTLHMCQAAATHQTERERGSAEERLGRQEEWGEPSGLTYLYPGQALPMERTGGGSRGQPSCPGPAQCVPGQGPSAGQPGTRSCPGQRTWASLVHRRGPQWGGRPQCARLGLSFRELETGAVYGDREQEVPPDSQGGGPEVAGDQWDAVLRQDLGSVPGTARATSPPPAPSPSLLHSGQEPGPGGHRLAPNRGRRPAGLVSGERPWARR